MKTTVRSRTRMSWLALLLVAFVSGCAMAPGGMGGAGGGMGGGGHQH